MKLYDTPLAPNPRRVRWFMAEKGIENVEVIEVDILTGAHKSPEYRARVGVPHVPALELDDGTTVSESVAICRYLEALYPEPNLFGHDAREQAIIEMWTRRCEFYLANPLMLSVRHSHPALAALDARILKRDLPERLLFCGGPALIEAAAELARIRDSALGMQT